MNALRLLICCALLVVGTGPLRADDATRPVPPLPAEDLGREVTALRDELRRLAAELAALRAAANPALEARLAAAEERLARLDGAVAGVETKLAETATASRTAAETVEQLQQAQERDVHLTTYGAFVAEDTSRADSTYDAESFELVLSGQPHPRLGVFAEIEFERAAAVGGERGGEVLLEQAFATYRVAPWASLRAGALLVPFGNVNVDHYAPVRDTISKPLVSTLVAPSDWTDNGLGLSGSVGVGESSVVRYDAVLVAGLDADVTALGTRAAREPFGSDNNRNKAVVARIAWKLGGGLEVGASGYRGRYDDANRLGLDGWAVDLLATAGPLRVTGEYDLLRAEQPAGRDGRLDGWYLRGSLDVLGSWLRSGSHGRLFPDARLALVGQYDRIDLAGPLDGVREANTETRWTLGINYRPAHAWVAKLDREWRRADRRALVYGSEDAFLASVGFVF